MGKPSAWTEAKSRPVYLYRGSRGQGYEDPERDPVDPEFKFLVLMLEKLGCEVHRAHGGRSEYGLWILFAAPYSTALRLAKCWFFEISLRSEKDLWVISWGSDPPCDLKRRDQRFRVMSRQMIELFGPLPDGGSRIQPSGRE